MSDVKVIVGGSLEQDAADFLDAWKRTDSGETVAASRVLSFDSWEGLSSVLTGERYRLLRYVHGHPGLTISGLAREIDRQYSRVHVDVTALETAGLLRRVDGGLHTTADRITVAIAL